MPRIRRSPTVITNSWTAALCGRGKTYSASIFTSNGFTNRCFTSTVAMYPLIEPRIAVCSRGTGTGSFWPGQRASNAPVPGPFRWPSLPVPAVSLRTGGRTMIQSSSSGSYPAGGGAACGDPSTSPSRTVLHDTGGGAGGGTVRRVTIAAATGQEPDHQGEHGKAAQTEHAVTKHGQSFFRCQWIRATGRRSRPSGSAAASSTIR